MAQKVTDVHLNNKLTSSPTAYISTAHGTKTEKYNLQTSQLSFNTKVSSTALSNKTQRMFILRKM